MTGTQQYTSSSGPHESEIPLRYLAAENRTRRRMLALGMLEVVNMANENQRFVRIFQSTEPKEPYYVFLSLSSTYANSEDEYREVRRGLLEAYMLVCKRMNPDAQDIVGIAISPTSESGCSEDLAYLDARDWTAELAAEAESLQTDLKILQNVTRMEGRYSEYPDVACRRVRDSSRMAAIPAMPLVVVEVVLNIRNAALWDEVALGRVFRSEKCDIAKTLLVARTPCRIRDVERKTKNEKTSPRNQSHFQTQRPRMCRMPGIIGRLVGSSSPVCAVRAHRMLRQFSESACLKTCGPDGAFDHLQL